MTTPDTTPLCVDLDGTLVHGDTIWQGVRTLCTTRPHLLAAFPFWLWPGRAAFKRALFCRVAVQPGKLQFHQGLLRALREEKARGRTVILVTGADQSVADALLAHTAKDHAFTFDEALGSDGARNLTGVRKAAELVRRYGAKQFDYAGNSRVDLPVWLQSRAAWVVATSPRDPLIARARDVAEVARLFTWDSPAAS